MENNTGLKTPLYDIHVKLKGKVVPFAGYLLPIQYEGIIKEHNAVRNAVGIFDVSHMGEFIIEGDKAMEAINHLVTNDISKMYAGQVKYSPMCNPNGGVIDDLLIYKMGETKYMLVVNASNMEKDFDWITKNLPSGVTLTNKSDQTGLIALQGPKALPILQKLTQSPIPEKGYTFTPDATVGGVKTIISRTGYTGEDGFEFYLDYADTAPLFEAIWEAGAEFGIVACGLGARDTLRLEASMPLYGHEMNDDITPIETGLKFFVKMDKADFIGKKALEEKGAPKITRVGLEITDKGIAREHCDVFLNGVKIGETTSGTMSPFTGKAVAMALIDIEHKNAEGLTVDVRGRKLNAKIVPMPFYKKNY